MSKQAYKGGYIGLVSILIAVALIAFLAMKIYSSSGGLKNPALDPNSQGMTPIQQAEEAKRLLEKNSQMNAEINIQPDSIRPGDPVLITIISSSTPKEIRWDNKNIPIFMYEGKYRAFVAVNFNEQDLTQTLAVKYTDGRNILRDVLITPREKIVGTLGIPEKLGGDTPEAAVSLVNNMNNENLMLNSVISAASTFWDEPFQYPLSSVFVVDDYGYDRQTVGQVIPHKGTDFRAPIGTPVMAMNHGIVRIARQFTIYGNAVVIDHGLGVQTLYLHLSELHVKEGDIVGRGQVIGLSGDTGYAAAPHLHVSLKINSISIDPMTFMRFFPQATP